MENKTETRITELDWGHMQVEVGGAVHTFKDCKVWPGGACAWDWSETGTRHQPGVQPADIAAILAQGVEVMVIACGMQLKLQTCPETEQLLQERGITYYIEETREAVNRFNALMQAGENVGGIFHSTC